MRNGAVRNVCCVEIRFAQESDPSFGRRALRGRNKQRSTSLPDLAQTTAPDALARHPCGSEHLIWNAFKSRSDLKTGELLRTHNHRYAVVFLIAVVHHSWCVTLLKLQV